MKDVTFDGNYSGGSGGAAYLRVVDAFEAENLTAIENEANNYGSVIYIHTVDGIVSNVSAVGNVTKIGGAVYVSTSAAITFDGGKFESNVAQTNNGGAIWTTANAVSATLNGVLFDGNTSAKNGGAIHAIAPVTAADCTFTNNTATGNGGAVYTEGNLTVCGGALKTNEAVYGGGIYIAEGGNVTLQRNEGNGTLFEENSVGNGGGAIYIAAKGALTATGADFVKNNAVSNGGAIVISSGASVIISLTDCTFSGNTAGGDGGALDIRSGSVVEMYDTTARNNTAYRGGFIWITSVNSSLTLDGNTTVAGNDGTANGAGDCIQANNAAAVVKIKKSAFVDEDNATVDWSKILTGKMTTITEIA